LSRGKKRYNKGTLSTQITIYRKTNIGIPQGIRFKDSQGKVFSPAHVRMISWLSVLPFTERRQ
ncbi:MAG: hypothetical protein K0U82_21615, partial [Planctomycetes bacterium]|nr:hypothetical protein [Planctomycetota bacterium]